MSDSEEFNYKKFIPVGLHLIIASRTLYNNLLLFIFPETWFANAMKRKENTIITVCVEFLTLLILKQYLIYFLLTHLIFFIIIFMLCKNNYTILSYLITCIICSIDLTYHYVYNTAYEEIHKNPDIKNMNDLYRKLNKDQFEEFWKNNKIKMNPTQKAVIAILSHQKDKDDGDYKEIVDLLYKAAEEIKIETEDI
jgi:hypothetical protein